MYRPKADTIVLSNQEKIGLMIGRIGVAIMPVIPDTYPRGGFSHPILKLDDIVQVDNELFVKIGGIRLDRIQSVTDIEARLCGYPKRSLVDIAKSIQPTLLTNEVTYLDRAWDEKYGIGAYDLNEWVWIFSISEWGEIRGIYQ